MLLLRGSRMITYGLVMFLVSTIFLIPSDVSAQSTSESLKSGPYVDRIMFNVITGDDQQISALINDEIDIIGDTIDPAFLETLQEAEDIEVATQLTNGYGYLSINCDKYPFNITDFRRAMFMSIDYENAVKAILGPNSNTVDLSWPEGHWIYSAENQELFDEMYPYDPVEAKRIIDELDAELPLDYHGTLYFVSWKGHEFLPLIEYIVNEWKALGIPVELRMTEAGQKYEVMGQTGPEDMDFIIYHFYIALQVTKIGS